MSPGREVRLKYAYYITCTEVIKDEGGKVIELICEYDPQSRGGDTPDGRKVKGTIQWVDASSAQSCEVRLYDRLFKTPDPDKVEGGGDFTDNLNPDSFRRLKLPWSRNPSLKCKLASPSNWSAWAISVSIRMKQVLQNLY